MDRQTERNVKNEEFNLSKIATITVTSKEVGYFVVGIRRKASARQRRNVKKE